MRQYEVTRSTVRSALGVLGAEGLVTPEQGAGVFVRERPEQLPFDLLPRPSPTGERPFRLGGGEQRQLRASAADPVTASHLQVAPGSPVACWSGRVAAVGGRDMLGLVAVSRSEPLGRRALRPTSATARFLPGSSGIPPELDRLDVTGYNDLVSARMPTPDERRELRLEQGVPVIQVMRQWWSRDRIRAVGVLIAAADRTVVRLTSDSPPA